MTFNGVASAKVNQYLEVSNQGTITINNSTDGGTNSGIIVSAVGALVQSGTAGSMQRADISGGQVNHNGGNTTNLFKRLFGTLTTGNFTHNSIVHVMNAARTLTTNNSSRGEYAGLAAGAYAAGGILA